MKPLGREWWNGRSLNFSVRPPPTKVEDWLSGPPPMASTAMYGYGTMTAVRLSPENPDQYRGDRVTIGRYAWLTLLWRMPTVFEADLLARHLFASFPLALPILPRAPDYLAHPAHLLKLASVARLTEQWRWAVYETASDPNILENIFVEMSCSPMTFDSLRAAETGVLTHLSTLYTEYECDSRRRMDQIGVENDDD